MTYRSGDGASLNVFYTGPGLAGVSTSLGVLVPPNTSRAGACCRHDRERADRGFWFEDGDRRRFVRLASDYRGNLFIRSIREGTASDDDRLRDDCVRALAFLPSVHGIVFVADSQAFRSEANLERLERIVEDLRSVGRDAAEVPFVFHLNKRDVGPGGLFGPVPDEHHPGKWVSGPVPNEVLTVAELRRQLLMPRCAYVESVATKGQGVREALEALVRLVGR